MSQFAQQASPPVYGEWEREGASRPPALTEFKDVLFSLVQLCHAGSLASSAAVSPIDGGVYSRSQSIVSDDYSGVPPEEPEWLSKMAAYTYNHRAISGRPRPTSRKDSGLTSGVTAMRTPGVALPSPLRGSFSVAGLLGEEASALSSGAPSPRTFDRGQQALFEKFGSFEGMSAAVDDFYHRLCRDERIGDRVEQVPEQEVRYIIMQLMALCVQQHHHHHGDNLLETSSPERRTQWSKHCWLLLNHGRGQGGLDAAPELSADDTAAAYDAVMGHLEATLERLGVLGSNGDGALGQEEDEGKEAEVEAMR